MATQIFNAENEDGLSDAHTIATDITTICLTCSGSFPKNCSVNLLVETTASSGVYVEAADWELTGPGVKNVMANGAAGIKMKLRVNNLTGNGVSISAWAN